MRTLSQTDFENINAILKVIPFSEITKEQLHLSDELRKVKVVKDNKLAKDVIKINSVVAVEDLTKKSVMEFQIVMPEHADMKEMKISFLAPLAIALLGFKKDFVVEWHMPAGPRKLKITKVENLSSVNV
ncbi:MAG TPA: GreA/GreB family elongation factor [Anditalea sp.]|nr:GreA/GreB family elongation factor [Anditalea sp.]